jgi:hypothetical protein
VISLKIVSVENGSNHHAITIKAILGTHEFTQLQGNIQDICVFATHTIDVHASFIKTGARHSHAKFLLLPAALRRKLPINAYDFRKMTCGIVHYKEELFIVYRVPRVSRVAPASSGQ